MTDNIDIETVMQEEEAFSKLSAFIAGGDFAKLSEESRALLITWVQKSYYMKGDANMADNIRFDIEEVMQEEEAFRRKFAKLTAFIAGSDFAKLNKTNQALLIIQESVMRSYLSVLIQIIRLNA